MPCENILTLAKLTQWILLIILHLFYFDFLINNLTLYHLPIITYISLYLFSLSLSRLIHIQNYHLLDELSPILEYSITSLIYILYRMMGLYHPPVNYHITLSCLPPTTLLSMPLYNYPHMPPILSFIIIPSLFY